MTIFLIEKPMLVCAGKNKKYLFSRKNSFVKKKESNRRLMNEEWKIAYNSIHVNIQIHNSFSLGKHLIIQDSMIKRDTSLAELSSHLNSKWRFVNADFTAVKQL